MSAPSSPLIVYLIQHVDDPRRQEPRNIGVIVVSSDQVAYQIVDPDEQTFSKRYRRAAEVIVEDETYPAWLAYWQRALERGRDGLDEIVDRQKPSFPIVLAGELMGDIRDDVITLADRYFDELVLPLPESPSAASEGPVQKVLRDSGVISSRHFHRNYALPSTGLPIQISVPFSYAWVNGHTAVADQLLYRTGDSRLTASLWKFEHVAEDVRCIAIVDNNIDRRPAALREYLHRQAQVIRVEDPDAPNQLREAFGGS
jgi:hypothetical protein